MKRATITFPTLLSFMGMIVACQPNLGANPTPIDNTRFLAVRADPAEVSPGDQVSYTALVVGPKDDVAGQPVQEVTDAPIDWAFCNNQKPLSDMDDVSSACFAFGADFLDEMGTGPTASGTMPATTCSLFGPDVPPSVAGQPSGRPTDPDLTGGYYQPVRLIYTAGADQNDNVLSAMESRVICNLPGASSDVLTQFKKEYKANTNTAITSVAVGSSPLAKDDGKRAGFAVKRGSKVTFTTSWPACPTTAVCGDGVCSPEEDATACPDDCTTPVGCTGAERYAYFDPSSRVVAIRRESMTVSWFATAGSFAQDRNLVAEDDTSTKSSNTWTSPTSAQSVYLWVVLRDSRGGVSWERYLLDVQ